MDSWYITRVTQFNPKRKARKVPGGPIVGKGTLVTLKRGNGRWITRGRFSGIKIENKGEKDILVLIMRLDDEPRDN